MADSQGCEFLEGCPIFEHFHRYAKQVYIDMYCKGDCTTCKRYQLRTAGQPVPKNLLPHGGTLWSK